MKCSCGTLNEDSATFCRSCGKHLNAINVMDKFPEFNLMPTSLTSPQGLKKHIFFMWLFRIFGLLSFIAILGAFLERIIGINHTPNELDRMMIICGILTAVSFILSAYFKNKTTFNNIPEVADYIQTSGNVRRYPIIVKNNKIGVYDLSAKSIIIPCEYERLGWDILGKVLNVYHKEKGQMKIDIHNNELN